MNNIYRLWVHMGDHEWSSQRGGRIMEELAREYAQEHQDKRPLIIEVWEHGGWFHTYFFGEDNTPHLLWTANDAAPLSRTAKQVVDKYANHSSYSLGSVRRK